MKTAISNDPSALKERADLVQILLVSLEELAAADRADAACRLAGQVCAVLRRSDPMAWNRFNILLHRLASLIV